VTFDIDANGILSVTAKDMATGKDQRITITASSGLNKDDIDTMVKDAAAHEEEDKRRREQIERRNKLDNFCYTMEKQISENREKLDATLVSQIEGLVKEGREAVEKQDDTKVQDVLARLEREAHQLASKLYEAAPGGGAGPAPGPGSAPGDGSSSGNGSSNTKTGDVIDAEFEETK
jgi:molecular chaperone DnaK